MKSARIAFDNAPRILGRAGAWLRLVSLSMAALLSSRPVAATVCFEQEECRYCGYRLVRPLADRTVAPTYQLELEFNCLSDIEPQLPELRQADGSVVPSEWEAYPEWRAIPQWNDRDYVQRFIRVGPELPLGPLSLGASSPRECSHTVVSSCASRSIRCAREDSCCDQVNSEAMEFIPALEFQVAEPSNPSQGDASQAAPPNDLQVRCSIRQPGSAVQFYLDTGNASLDPNLIRIELSLDSPLLEQPKQTVWSGEPCLGQRLRDFSGYGELSLPPDKGEVSYALGKYGENGLLEEGQSGVLNVPQDCVDGSDISLSFQRLQFSTWCPESSSAPLLIDWAQYPETQLSGSCEAPLRAETDAETDDGIIVVTEPMVEPESQAPAPQQAMTEPPRQPSPETTDVPLQTRSCSMAFPDQHRTPWIWSTALSLLLVARLRKRRI